MLAEIGQILYRLDIGDQGDAGGTDHRARDQVAEHRTDPQPAHQGDDHFVGGHRHRPDDPGVVVIGLEPLTALLWTGTEWQEEALGDTRRLPEGGLVELLQAVLAG